MVKFGGYLTGVGDISEDTGLQSRMGDIINRKAIRLFVHTMIDREIFGDPTISDIISEKPGDGFPYFVGCSTALCFRGLSESLGKPEEMVLRLVMFKYYKMYTDIVRGKKDWKKVLREHGDDVDYFDVNPSEEMLLFTYAFLTSNLFTFLANLSHPQRMHRERIIVALSAYLKINGKLYVGADDEGMSKVILENIIKMGERYTKKGDLLHDLNFIGKSEERFRVRGLDEFDDYYKNTLLKQLAKKLPIDKDKWMREFESILEFFAKVAVGAAATETAVRKMTASGDIDRN